MESNMKLSSDDRQAITDIIHRFFWLVDHGRAGETADLFAGDARITFGPGTPNPGTIEGAAIRAAMTARATHTHVTTRHVLSNIALSPNPNGSVSAYSLLTLFRSDDETRDSAPASVADIDEIYVRNGAVWRIQERIIMPIFNRA